MMKNILLNYLKNSMEEIEKETNIDISNKAIEIADNLYKIFGNGIKPKAGVTGGRKVRSSVPGGAFDNFGNRYSDTINNNNLLPRAGATQTYRKPSTRKVGLGGYNNQVNCTQPQTNFASDVLLQYVNELNKYIRKTSNDVVPEYPAFKQIVNKFDIEFDKLAKDNSPEFLSMSKLYKFMFANK